jgi:predicted nucleic acid-binding protein
MESPIYPDSSFLASLVCKDGNTAEATACMSRVTQPLIFTPLHRIEVRNALRNAMGRKEITASDQRAAFRLIEQDLREGLLIHMPVDWPDVFRRADELGEKHAGTDGQRTIDLLHVALALECVTKTLLSFDRRQRRLAKAVGLSVKP